nr:DUF1826 domain-containing protein [Roseibium hamelinense]
MARDVLTGRDADILYDIWSPGVAAAIWTRRCDDDFERWIDNIPEACLPEIRTVVPVHLAEAAAIAACDQAKIPAGPELDMLTGDIAALALMLAKALNTRRVRIRLDVASDVMCPKFHQDNVQARLLCTYRGAGTQYVPLGFEADPKRIRSVPRGAAALFRGAASQGGEQTGLLHRSPSVDPKDGARLLLVIDPAD